MKHEEAVKMYLEKAGTEDNLINVKYDSLNEVVFGGDSYSAFCCHINEILFNIDYAKKVWGEEWTCKECGKKETEHYQHSICGEKYHLIPRWLYIMQQLCGMTNEERLDYLVKLFEEVEKI